MPAIMRFDALEEVPEEIRTDAREVEENGKKFFEVSPTGLLSKRDQLLAEVKQYKEKADKLKEFAGLDPEKAKRALIEMEKLEDDRKALQRAIDDAVTVERGKVEMDWRRKVSDVETAKSGVEKQLQSFRSQLENVLVDAELTKHIASAKGITEFLLPEMKKHAKVVEESGQFKVVINNPKTGQPTTEDGKPFGFTNLVEQYKADKIWSRAFEGSGASGSGASSHVTTGGDGVVRLTREQAKNALLYREALKQAGNNPEKILIEG